MGSGAANWEGRDKKCLAVLGRPSFFLKAMRNGLRRLERAALAETAVLRLSRCVAGTEGNFNF